MVILSWLENASSFKITCAYIFAQSPFMFPSYVPSFVEKDKDKADIGFHTDSRRSGVFDFALLDSKKLGLKF